MNIKLVKLSIMTVLLGGMTISFIHQGNNAWQTISASNEPVVSTTEKTADDKSNQEKPITAQQIVSWNLFGKPIPKKVEPKKVVKVEPKTNTIQKTKLKLTLQGVFMSDDPEKASAIIESPKEGALFYAQGDKVPGNAILHSVQTDSVTLKRNGQLETLEFPQSKNTSRSASTRYSKPPINNFSRRNRNNFEQPSPRKAIFEKDEDEDEVIRNLAAPITEESNEDNSDKRLEELRKRLLSQPNNQPIE